MALRGGRDLCHGGPAIGHDAVANLGEESGAFPVTCALAANDEATVSSVIDELASVERVTDEQATDERANGVQASVAENDGPVIDAVSCAVEIDGQAIAGVRLETDRVIGVWAASEGCPLS